MIFIDPAEVLACLPAKFFEEARTLEHAIDACGTAAERTTAITRGSDVWRSVKTFLADLASHKCWYCETRVLRADNAVDHFRPKGRLAEDGTHGGYWWLAFKAENYRFSCTFCNSHRIDVRAGTSGGKQDHFPIADESKRSRRPADPVSAESPILLDPCSAYDVSLLWFDESGQVRENPNAINLNPAGSQRVIESTKLYHWDQASIVSQRRRRFYRVLRICAEADLLLEDALAGVEAAERAYREAFEEAVALCSSRAEYSRAARSAIHGYVATSSTARLVAQSFA